jgi:predicted TIM-barrel fold metal-dependent hydrolase
MYRPFDLATYRRESAGWPVEKIVNVAAATGPHSVDETLHLDRRADAGDGPDAIVGGLPPTETVAEAVALLDTQMEASRFRGVRPMGAAGPPVPDRAVLAALAERDLLFELMAHTDQLEEAAEALAAVDDLVVVVEHAGWPRSGEDDELARWKVGMTALADLGPRVSTKLSGLAMPLGTMRTAVLAPWLEFAIETFGVERCLFASNFPVDAMHGTFDELYGTFVAVTAGLDAGAVDRLFATNAEHLYRC